MDEGVIRWMRLKVDTFSSMELSSQWILSTRSLSRLVIANQGPRIRRPMYCSLFYGLWTYGSLCSIQPYRLGLCGVFFVNSFIMDEGVVRWMRLKVDTFSSMESSTDGFWALEARSGQRLQIRAHELEGVEEGVDLGCGIKDWLLTNLVVLVGWEGDSFIIQCCVSGWHHLQNLDGSFANENQV